MQLKNFSQNADSAQSGVYICRRYECSHRSWIIPYRFEKLIFEYHA